MTSCCSNRLIAVAVLFAAQALWSCTHQPTTTDASAASLLGENLPMIAARLQRGEVTAELVVTAYIERIEAIDRAGPTLQSVLSINPDAIAEARRLDRQYARSGPTGPLHGVPILLKDNIESADRLATTAGAWALRDNVTGRDAPVAAALRAAGAIILGKTNMSEWANFRSNDSLSGWSALGGQVRNPHLLDRNPCGSSSGSGAAIAAALAAGALGTETNGSITCPANANGIVGFKPTLGLLSQQYIVPISFSQDTAGPMTRSVRGAAMMLGAMVGEDYAAGLSGASLHGVRIGVLRFAEGSNDDISSLFATALGDLESLGAELVDIDDFENSAENFWRDHGRLLRYEFKATLDDYLAASPADIPVRSLTELIEYNRLHADIELVLFAQNIFEEAAALGDLSTPEYIAARDAIQSAAREDGIDQLLSEYEVDVLVAPSGPVAPPIDPVNGDVWPAWAGAGWMAAVAGYPHLTVPMGAVHKVPVGLSFMGTAGQDAAILAYGYAYEQRSQKRVTPAFLNGAEDIKALQRALQRRPPAEE